MIDNLSDLYVSVSVLCQLMEYVKACGIRPEDVLGAVDLDISILTDPDTLLSQSDYIKIEESAATLCQDPCFGLHVGELHKPGHWNILGKCLESCTTLGEVFTISSRYWRILGNLISSKAWPIPGGVRISLVIPPGLPDLSDHCYESALASSVCLARTLTGTNFRPIRVRLHRNQPQDSTIVEEYERVFGCTVNFGAKTNGMDIPLSAIGLRVNAANESKFENWKIWADSILNERKTGGTTILVTRTLVKMIHKPNVSLRNISKALAMSTRSLQTALTEERTSFSKLLDETRRRLSCQWLDEGLTLEEITFALGFSEQSVFSKAFRKWTGQSPSQYRKNLKRIS